MNGGMSTPTNRKMNKQRYTFDCMLEEVRIAVRFPCRIAVAWNYGTNGIYAGQGEVRTATSKPLTSGVAKFQEKLTFAKLIGMDQETRQYAEAKSIVEVSILTDNGTSLAGFVSIDLAAIVGRKERRELYEIERCPDKTASIRMRMSCQLCDDRPRNRVRLQSEIDDEFEMDQEMKQRLPPYRSITPRSQYHPQTIVRKSIKSPQQSANQRNKDVLEREMMIIKGRVSEMENRFKMERTEKEKLAETLKAKEDVYFTMKTELKRREIQVADAGRSIEDYRTQYQKTKGELDACKKECERLQRLLQTNDKAAFDKMARMETDLAALERKNEKTQTECEKLRKEKDNLSNLHRTKLEELIRERESLNQVVRVLKKEKDEIVRQTKSEKAVSEKSTRDTQKRLTDLQEQVETYRSNLMMSQRKTGKLDELRSEQTTKLKQSLNQLEHMKEKLSMELEAFKMASLKKESAMQESLRNVENRLQEQKNSNSAVKAALSQLQSQMTILQVDNGHLLKDKGELEERRALLEEDRARLEKQYTLLKTQSNSLSEQLHEKNLEIRTLVSKMRQDEQSNNLKMGKMKEMIEQLQQNAARLIQQRKNEENKSANTLKLLSKKEKELQDWMIRQGRLNAQVQSVRTEMKKLEHAYRDKIEQSKKCEASLKYALAEAGKQNDDLNEKLGNKLAEQVSINRRLESGISELQDHLSAATSREHQLRQECARINSELSHLFEARELLQASEQKLRDYEWRIQQITDEIRVRALREERLQADNSQLKSRTIELQADLIKKENQLKDKEKLMGSHLKHSNTELQQKSKQYVMKEAEHRAVHDELKEVLRRERIKISQMLLEQQKLNSQMAILEADCERQQTTIATFQSEMKLLKDTNRNEVEERQLLAKKLQDAETKCMRLEESRLNIEIRVADRDKEIRQLKYANSELEQRTEELSRGQLRSQLMLTEILEAAVRLEGLSTASFSSETHIQQDDEPEKLSRIKKLLALAEGRVRKVLELSIEKDEMLARERSKQLSQGEKSNTELSRLRAESVKLKKDVDELAYSASMLKADKEELARKAQDLESDLAASKKMLFQMEMRLKAQTQEKDQAEEDLRAATAKYQSLLAEVRSTLSEKAQKQRKEQLTIIKRQQQKIEEQQEKIFALQLQCQKLGELSRLQEDNRRLSVRVFELEKENLHTIQQSSSKLEKLQSQMDNLTWEKKILQENHSSFLSKNQKILAGLHAEVEQLNAKNKSLQQQARTNDEQIRRLEDSFNRSKSDLAAAKSAHHDDHDKWVAAENKLKAENTKLRTEAAQLRKTVEEQNLRIVDAQQMKAANTNLRQELSKTTEQLQAHQQKVESLTEEVFLKSQKLQQQKYTYDKLIEQKENEIVGMQEEIFKVNSKDNVRFLKETETNEKLRHMDSEKKTLNREVVELRGVVEQLQEQLRILQNENDILQDQLNDVRVPSWPTPNRQDQMVSKLQNQVDELQEENDRLRCSSSAFRISSQI